MKRKTIEIPDDETGAKPTPKPEPFAFWGNPADNRPVRVGTGADGLPLYAPPRRFWTSLGGLR